MLCFGVGSAAAQSSDGDRLKGELLFENSFADGSAMHGWRMEGEATTEHKDGWMHIQSPSEAGHHVFWCP